MEIDEHLWVAVVEVDALLEKHRGVGVRVKGKNLLVYFAGAAEGLGLRHEPAEERQHTFIAVLNKSIRDAIVHL